MICLLSLSTFFAEGWLSYCSKYLCYSSNKQLETLTATPFTNTGIHERINKKQADLSPWPVNTLSRPFIRDAGAPQSLLNEKRHLQENPWRLTLWHKQYCSVSSTYHAAPPILEVTCFSCWSGEVVGDIPAPWGRHATLQRVLQKVLQVSLLRKCIK